MSGENLNKLEAKNRSYTFSKFAILPSWPSYKYIFNHKTKTTDDGNIKVCKSVDNKNRHT